MGSLNLSERAALAADIAVDTLRHHDEQTVRNVAAWVNTSWMISEKRLLDTWSEIEERSKSEAGKAAAVSIQVAQ